MNEGDRSKGCVTVGKFDFFTYSTDCLSVSLFCFFQELFGFESMLIRH
jgi:hypothetical protein